MPTGCGYDMSVPSRWKHILISQRRTWPAVWTVGADWPNQVHVAFNQKWVVPWIYRDQGEIDILEGINNVGPNQVTLHTSAGPCFQVAGKA
jgi:hypothetical protein